MIMSYLQIIYFGIFLQGFQEGGCITTIGLYFGDRLHIKKYIICPNCKQPQTIIYKKSKLTFQYCISCFSSNSISI